MKSIAFSIKSMPGVEFRTKDISPVDILTIFTTSDFSDFKKTKDTFNYILENIEVKQGELWMEVKHPGREVYMPIGIENNIIALNELTGWFMENVIGNSFQESSE